MKRLLQATNENDVQKVRELLDTEYGDDQGSINETDEQGRTALFLAAEQGYTVIVRLLIHKGADVTQFNNEGLTALDIASKNARTSTIPWIQEAVEKANRPKPAEQPTTEQQAKILLDLSEKLKEKQMNHLLELANNPSGDKARRHQQDAGSLLTAFGGIFGNQMKAFSSPQSNPLFSAFGLLSEVKGANSARPGSKG
jgi:ankyrin repeat protein